MIRIKWMVTSDDGEVTQVGVENNRNLVYRQFYETSEENRDWIRHEGEAVELIVGFNPTAFLIKAMRSDLKQQNDIEYDDTIVLEEPLTVDLSFESGVHEQDVDVISDAKERYEPTDEEIFLLSKIK